MKQEQTQLQEGGSQFEQLQNEFKRFGFKFNMYKFSAVWMLFFPVLMWSVTYSAMSGRGFIEVISPKWAIYPDWFAIVLAMVYATFFAVWLFTIYSVFKTLRLGSPKLRTKLAESSLVQDLTAEAIRFEKIYEDTPKYLRSRWDPDLSSNPTSQAKALVWHLDWFLEKPVTYIPFHKSLMPILIFLAIFILLMWFGPRYFWLLHTPFFFGLMVLSGILHAQYYAKAVELKKYLCPNS